MLAGLTLAMKSVLVAPFRNSGVRKVATRKSRLLVMPWILVFSSNLDSPLAASRRVAACAINLANIGSKIMLTSLPVSTPESMRVATTFGLKFVAVSDVGTCHANNLPGDGKKLFSGSSA